MGRGSEGNNRDVLALSIFYKREVFSYASTSQVLMEILCRV